MGFYPLVNGLVGAADLLTVHFPLKHYANNGDQAEYDQKYPEFYHLTDV